MRKEAGLKFLSFFDFRQVAHFEVDYKEHVDRVDASGGQ